jgi:hypothetical protein
MFKKDSGEVYLNELTYDKVNELAEPLKPFLCILWDEYAWGLVNIKELNVEEKINELTKYCGGKREKVEELFRKVLSKVGENQLLISYSVEYDMSFLVVEKADWDELKTHALVQED